MSVNLNNVKNIYKNIMTKSVSNFFGYKISLGPPQVYPLISYLNFLYDYQL